MKRQYHRKNFLTPDCDSSMHSCEMDVSLCRSIDDSIDDSVGIDVKEQVLVIDVSAIHSNELLLLERLKDIFSSPC